MVGPKVLAATGSSTGYPCSVTIPGTSEIIQDTPVVPNTLGTALGFPHHLSNQGSCVNVMAYPSHCADLI